MTTTNTKFYSLITLFAVLIALWGAFAIFAPRTTTPTSGSTIAYAVPKIASSSLVVVGPQNVQTIAPVASNCVDRVISTVGTAIQLGFGGAVVPTGTTGHVQGASTSITYNNGDYGCGAITGYAAASTTITVSTFTQ